MRGAPGWAGPGESVDGLWKAEVLKALGVAYQAPVLVETGTCEGSTLIECREFFEVLHSIELSRHYFLAATSRLSRKGFLHPEGRCFVYQGDSRQVMPWLLTYLVPTSQRVVFWLDAHSSGGLTANEGDPLAAELEAIMAWHERGQGDARNNHRAWIVIDDLADASLRHIEEQGVRFDGWDRAYLTGLVIMAPSGFLPFWEALERWKP